MTARELSQLRMLNKEADLLRGRLREAEEAATSTTTRLTGMPRGSGVGDQVSRYAAAIADLKEQIAHNLCRCLEELKELYQFIEGIDDSFMRQVMVYRYIHGLSWQQVANRLGNTCTGDTVRISHDRFLKRRAGEECRRGE